ncbi:MAG: hypothetical protein U0Y10_21740 [Spirosomataceae bacterium]
MVTFSQPRKWYQLVRYGVMLAILVGMQTCECEKKSQIIPAQITTGAVSAITYNSAKCDGVLDPGTETVSEMGHCWSEQNNQPTVNDTKVAQVPGKTKQTFTTSLTALTPEKLYYVRAYAIIANKAYYGDLVTLTTAKAPIPPPTLTTDPATEIVYNSAKVSFKIQFAAGGSASQHGICWSTNSNPTTNDNKTNLGNATGTVNSASVLSGLSEKTTYYARAYAVVGTDTFYGNIVNFTTPGIAPTITTGNATEVITNSAKVSFTIQFAPGTSATQYGICWATTNTPTTNDNKTSLGAIATNVSTTNSLTNLSAKTTYYVRAYAVVNGTTYYGNVTSFSTSDSAPTITTGSVTEVQVSSAKVALTLQLAAGTSASQYGICWATNNNPTTNDGKTSLGATSANVNTTSTLTGLSSKTTYYARAYAVVNGTTYYGNVVNFTTQTDTPQTSDGSPGFLFYNSSSGQAVFGEVVNNTYRDIRALGSIGNSWTHVVPYQGMLFLVSSANGPGALFDGKQIIKNFPGGSFVGWTHITPINDQWLLFYNANTGAFEFGQIQNTNYQALLRGTNFSTGWSTILSFGKDILFYNASTGAGTWGSFNGSAFSQYAENEKLSTGFNAITYGNNASFWWYRNTGEVGYVNMYAPTPPKGAKPSFGQIQQINLKLFRTGIVTAGNNQNLLQMLNTTLDIYSVAGDNKLTYQRTSDINAWTHLVAVKFN